MAGASPADACLATVNTAAETQSTATAATTPTQILLDNWLIRRTDDLLSRRWYRTTRPIIAHRLTVLSGFNSASANSLFASKPVSVKHFEGRPSKNTSGREPPIRLLCSASILARMDLSETDSWRERKGGERSEVIVKCCGSAGHDQAASLG